MLTSDVNRVALNNTGNVYYMKKIHVRLIPKMYNLLVIVVWDYYKHTQIMVLLFLCHYTLFILNIHAILKLIFLKEK